MRKSGVFTLILLITTIVLAAMLLYSRAPKARTAQYDSTIIVEKIEGIQELATIKSNFTGVIGYKDALKLFSFKVPLTDKFFMLKYDGYMKAGVDFSRVHADPQGNKIVVTLPHAEIFDLVIDENSITVYNESENAFNPIKISDFTTAITKEKETLYREAVNGGLLDEAYRQAELTLTSFLKEMGFETVEIKQQLSLPKVGR